MTIAAGRAVWGKCAAGRATHFPSLAMRGRRFFTALLFLKVLLLSLTTTAMMLLGVFLLTGDSTLSPSSVSLIKGMRGYSRAAALKRAEHEKSLKQTGEWSAAVTAAPGGVARPAWDPALLDDPFSQKPDCDVHTFLVIIVTSAPANFDRRRAIRQSWGIPNKEKQYLSSFGKKLPEGITQVSGVPASDKEGPAFNSSSTSWRTIFLIGKAETPSLVTLVENEAVTFADILIGDYTDTYRNLTLKVVHGLTFSAVNCRPAYLLKTDDDCFVNVLLIITYLLNYNKVARKLYVGNVQVGSGVIRNPRSKWFVSADDYGASSYPPYPSGTGYVVSADALHDAVSTTQYVRPFPNEDAYVGVVMRRCGISPRNSYRFTLYSHRWQHCNYLYLMVIHRVPAYQQTSLYNRSEEAAAKCPGQDDITTWS